MKRTSGFKTNVLSYYAASFTLITGLPSTHIIKITSNYNEPENNIPVLTLMQSSEKNWMSWDLCALGGFPRKGIDPLTKFVIINEERNFQVLKTSLGCSQRF